MDKAQALHSFWSSFGWAAYDENSVPAEAQPPYITHESAISEFDRPIAQTANIWDRASSWNEAVAKEKLIADTITKGGKIIHYDGGAFIIRKGSPWAQRMGDNDPDIRRIILNYEIEFFD